VNWAVFERNRALSGTTSARRIDAECRTRLGLVRTVSDDQTHEPHTSTVVVTNRPARAATLPRVWPQLG
jgi:hypothetical protein